MLNTLKAGRKFYPFHPRSRKSAPEDITSPGISSVLAMRARGWERAGAEMVRSRTAIGSGRPKSEKSFFILNFSSAFCRAARGKLPPLVVSSRLSRETFSLVSIFLVPTDWERRHATGCRGGVLDLGAHLTRNFSAHGSIFSPFSSQCLSRSSRCLVAWRSSLAYSQGATPCIGFAGELVPRLDEVPPR